jgi:hypothetical protein
MKGTYIHNIIMADPVEAALRLKGYRPMCELPVRSGQRPQSVDLAYRANGRFVVMEFERTTDRIAADIIKAQELRADILKIIVPNATVRRRGIAAINRLGHFNQEQWLQVQVMTLGSVLEWIANNCPMRLQDRSVELPHYAPWQGRHNLLRKENV